MPALLLSILLFFLPSSVYFPHLNLDIPNREGLEKRLCFALHISYSYAEWYLPFSRGEVLTVTEIYAHQIVQVLGIIAIIYRDTLS